MYQLAASVSCCTAAMASCAACRCPQLRLQSVLMVCLRLWCKLSSHSWDAYLDCNGHSCKRPCRLTPCNGCINSSSLAAAWQERDRAV